MFNLPEKIIVFDTEYTTWQGAQERNWSGENEYREIVQVGAVKVETDNFKELDSFSVFVKPKINPELSAFFTELTGITQEEVDKEGIDFKTAIEQFSRWSGDLSLYSWKGGDDDVLMENCRLLGITFPFEGSRFGTIGKVFQENGVSIENYMSSTIIEAFGKKTTHRGHNALNDARTIVDGLKELSREGI